MKYPAAFGHMQLLAWGGEAVSVISGCIGYWPGASSTHTAVCVVSPPSDNLAAGLGITRLANDLWLEPLALPHHESPGGLDWRQLLLYRWLSNPPVHF